MLASPDELALDELLPLERIGFVVQLLARGGT
jgi:hypothetical protein